jgi:hypothetical protein
MTVPGNKSAAWGAEMARSVAGKAKKIAVISAAAVESAIRNFALCEDIGLISDRAHYAERCNRWQKDENQAGLFVMALRSSVFLARRPPVRLLQNCGFKDSVTFSGIALN